MQTVIGELAQAEIPGACQLFQSVFGATTSPDQWAWKYQRGPRLGSVNVVARNDDGVLVGHAGASVFAGAAGATPLAMAQVCDVMVAKQARGGVEHSAVYYRLMVALQEALSQRFHNPYAYGFAGIRPFKLGQRLGLYREVCPCRPSYLKHAPHYKPPRFWTVQPIPWESTRLDRIWKRFSPSNTSPKVARPGAYLHWRYASHPCHTYKLWVIQNLWQDRGWFITRTLPNGEVCVVDALLPKQAHPGVLTMALARAMQSSGAASGTLFTWYLQTPQSLQTEPIVGSEVRVTQWHAHLPNPVFQPGDTDVF